MKKALVVLSKYQKYFLGLAIFLSLCAVSITIGGGEIKLNLNNYPILMFFLVLISIVFALIYISIDKFKIEELSKRIKNKSIDKRYEFETLLPELSSRQKEVFELIIAGKSNKEIMRILFIEQSTLKTHINQIYRKLKIRNRKELKSKTNL